MRIYKRFFAILFSLASICFVLFAYGCAADYGVKIKTAPVIDKDKFSVNFLSVGQGDCIFIRLPDGKNMLIDCGEESESTQALLSETLSYTETDRIDYLVLTHTDADHTGNALFVTEKFNIGKAFVPYILNKEEFGAFGEIYAALENRAEELTVSATGKDVLGDDYTICILSPDSEELNGFYDDLNYGNANSQSVNAISAVIYLEYKGVRFLFTGDAEKKTLNKVVQNAKAGLYKSFYIGTGRTVNLLDIDFLKVAHHGSSDAADEEFLEYVKPANAVISVGALNDYGHPSTNALLALLKANDQMNIYRTDLDGSVSVVVEEDGSYNVFLSSEK